MAMPLDNPAYARGWRAGWKAGRDDLLRDIESQGGEIARLRDRIRWLENRENRPDVEWTEQ